jgi:hypothetical protein
MADVTILDLARITAVAKSDNIVLSLAGKSKGLKKQTAQKGVRGRWLTETQLLTPARYLKRAPTPGRPVLQTREEGVHWSERQCTSGGPGRVGTREQD